MAIVFISKAAYLDAKKIGGDNLKKVIAEYKKSGQAYVEGPNSKVHNQPGYIRFMDKGGKKAPAKAKKVKKAKKAKK